MKNSNDKSRTISFKFPNSKGEQLCGKLEIPAGKVKSYAIFVHCFTGNKDFSANRRISRKLRELGFGVLRFDFTGLGKSKGEFSETNFTTNLDDLNCAYRQLAKRFSAPQILIGHSLGGAAVLSMASELDDVKAVITIGAPSSTHHLTHLFEDKLLEIQGRGQAKVVIGERPFVIKQQFLDDIRGHQVIEKLKSIKNKALLIFHSPQDETVEIDHAREIYVNAKHPKSFISLDGADHLLNKAQDAQYVANVIASWCERYIDQDDECELEDVVKNAS